LGRSWQDARAEAKRIIEEAQLGNDPARSFADGRVFGL